MEEPTDTNLLPDDLEKLADIVNAEPPNDIKLIYEYWMDLDRANRTPRSVLYFHFGMLQGVLSKLMADLRREGYVFKKLTDSVN